jgi:hypothetical protein
MDSFLIKIKILTDILEKKEIYLDKIYNLTANIKTILLSKMQGGEANEALGAMYKEKQVLIDEVIKSDGFFESTFQKLDGIFEKNAKLYKKEIEYMQKKIKSIMDLDSKIRLEEKNNNFLIVPAFHADNQAVKTVPKTLIVKKYSVNKKDTGI